MGRWASRSPARIADRFGAVRVLWAGAIALCAAASSLMAYATSPLSLDLGAGVLIGFGLAGCSFNLVLSARSASWCRRSWRSFAFGAGTAAGSFGQFLFSPLGRGLIDSIGWQNALTCSRGIMLLILPLALALATPRSTPAATCRRGRSSRSRQALAEAFGHRSYVLLVLGFFTCGFQLAFITVHLPAYLLDRGLTAADRRLDHRG